MARENRSDRGAMIALASVLVVFSLAVITAVPAGAYYYDTDGDGLPDFYEIKHSLHGDVTDEKADWDGDGLLDIEEDANQNGIVDVGETDPYNWDTDGDGISDGIEGLEDSDQDEDSLINALDLDSDGDFIPDGVEDDGDGVWEEVYGETNWLDADTDDDGLIDGWEAMWGTDPLNPNTDGDGWNDGYEVYLANYLASGIPDQNTDPTNPDCDGDGRYDGIGNEDLADADGDGIINALDFDSDNDGLIDSDEDMDEDGVVDTGETDPEEYDTDADGYSDGYEIYHAYTDPLDGGTDTDGDGWVDGMETVVYKTDPGDADTDGDGISDGIENPAASPGRDTDGDGLIDALDVDSDNDGLDDADEDVDGDGVVDAGETDPYDVDTDGDGLPDNAEYKIFGTDPTDADDPYDTDGVDPGDELYTYFTNFDSDDTDGDGVDEGLSSGTDRMNLNTDSSRPLPYRDSSINALDIDADGDGILDGEEVVAGADGYVTDMVDWDTDDDGLLDGEETHIWGTDPTDPDSDDDGLDDGDEVDTYGTDPLDPNTDGDYVDDGVEATDWGSNPLDPDTDGDGILDGETVTGTYIDADGVEQAWSFTEDDTDAELGGDGLPNVLDPDSDWREWEDPPTYVYLDFHDRTEIAYEAYVTPLVRAGERFHVGPLNPGDPDTDMDGYPDAQEVACGFDPLDARDYGDCSYTPDDTDADGLYDIEEMVLGTAIDDTDTDNDGLWDGDELHPTWWEKDAYNNVQYATNPLDDDVDGDGLDDLEEVDPAGGADGYVTNPHYTDTDGDGISDWQEVQVAFGYDPTDFDTDGDELYDGYEDADHDGTVDTDETDPLVDDHDGDSILDGPELIFGTDPKDTDTDGDGLTDGLEVGYASDGDTDTSTMTDPRIADSDFDGIEDGVEDADHDGDYDAAAGETDAQSRDSDDDGLPDYYEVPGNYATNPAYPDCQQYCVGWVDNSLDPTDPFAQDTEGDGLEDGIEFEQVCDPNVADTDGDGLSDGEEYYAWETDPTMTDTDGDGCDEQTGGGDIENVAVDTDGDGIHNGMDVDSDNDWVWDGDGDEDCAGANDADSDGIPDILDNDTDNDNLSDWQEMGLDTWHQFADNDRDFDEDGILDGDEYYQVIHQPHTGEVGFRASDPKDFDTDGDGLHDGLETGKDAPIPVDPILGGTNPDPGIWDPDGDGVWYGDPANTADGTIESDVRFADSDMDGLTDDLEDADMDGEYADYGVGNTETWPEDDDSDDDGLIDGYEVNTIGTDPLSCDTDSDFLADGLEWGILAPMGNDTDPVNPCSSERYDTVENGAYHTDPLDDDTDDDHMIDGDEDADGDGYRDGNDPFDTTSDWNAGAGPGEPDPNEWDTDRGGVADGDEVSAGDDPLLYTDGDWDIDIDNGDYDVVGNVMDIGADDGVSAVPPASSGSGDFIIYHPDPGAVVPNVDAFDGPSQAAAPIDTVYFRATSLHWAGGLANYTYDVPDTNTTDWIHYTAVSFDPPLIEDFAPGTSQVVTVTVDVPEGAMPGWYVGYAHAETKRDIEQELPDDWFELHVYVAPQKDLDIDDDDEYALGVGLASDPYDFPDPAAYGEMHLMGAPMYPGTVTGRFWVANPNTNPDGLWPYPGHSPDGINDYNGLPAIPEVALCWDPPAPEIGYTWDRDVLDPQGNVNLTYDIDVVYEHTSGPTDPTSYVTFDDAGHRGFSLGTKDTFHVYVDTSELPGGLYEGTVRVFEDVDSDGEYDAGEVSDTFTLKFWLTIPDLDIDDDYANMAGNELEIDVNPGDVDVMIGEIKVVCPGTGNNYDAWDGPSDESILDFQYYDPTTDALTPIPTDGLGQPASFWVYSPDKADSIEIWLDGIMGDTLLVGEEKKLRLRVAEVPEDLPAGTYRTDHPDAWVPGDGTVPICARGLATGIGWPSGVGPGVVYDPDIDATATLMDYFHLTVNVAAVIDVEFESASWAVTGDPGDHLCQATIVNNLGNADVDDVHFDVTQLVGATDPNEVILPSQIDFEPASIDIPLGGFESVDICVDIPNGQYAQTYEGFVSLLAEGEEEFDQLPVSVTVNCVAEMDVSETAYGVQGNVMTLIPGDGGAGMKQFELVNLGNCDVTGVTADVVGLPDGIDVTMTVDSTVGWHESVLGSVAAEWSDPWPGPGTYHGVVTVTADGGLSDSFSLDVIISPSMDISENAYDVVDNYMTLTPAAPRASGQFELRNTGTIDLSGIAAVDITGLPTGITATVSIDDTCPWNESILGTVDVDWTEPTVPSGEYTTTVTVTANGGLSDNFVLKVVITELAAAEFYDESVDVDGVAGETVEATFTVENTGNVDLAAGRVTFAAEDLVGASGSVIPAADIEVVPETAEIARDGEVDFVLRIAVPEGLLGQDYVGDFTMYLDGDLEDQIEVTVTLERGAELDDVVIYPNPYRASEHDGGVTIALGDVGDDLTIMVYDMFGAVVADLTPTEGQRGDTDIQWDLTNDDGKAVASGMYIVTIDNGDEVTTRKIMVIR